jgi:hypothetical protein
LYRDERVRWAAKIVADYFQKSWQIQRCIVACQSARDEGKSSFEPTARHDWHLPNKRLF